MIRIDDSPFSWTRYYGGEYTDSEGKEYEFTIVTTELEQIAEEITEINWIEETPSDKPEQEITDEWTEQHFAHFKKEQ